jgi:hypothetical protein
MVHVIIETTLMMLGLYLFGWILGMNMRTLSDDGLRTAVMAERKPSADQPPD